jgi:hypothetical protein
MAISQPNPQPTGNAVQDANNKMFADILRAILQELINFKK